MSVSPYILSSNSIGLSPLIMIKEFFFFNGLAQFEYGRPKCYTFN